MRTLALSLLLVGLTASAETRPGWLGFGYSNQTTVANGRIVRGWFLVRHVVPNGPAAKAGIRPHDLITHIDGKPLRYESDRAAVAAMKNVRPGQRLVFRVARGEQQLLVRVTAVAMPDGVWRLWKEHEQYLRGN